MAALIGFAQVSTPFQGALAQNVIRPDGRTATTVSKSGKITDVRTNTIHNGNAFNSFSRFEVGGGNTVNLHVPNSAGTLINVVRDAPVRVDGTLNAYKNGQIGGNVYFADPYGFIVGKGGSVNVGSLTVTTPTNAFVEELIGPGGAISDSHVARLMSGTFPISPNGEIRIDGRINAANGVRLIGHTIAVNGGSEDFTATQRQARTFAATVNASGLETAGGIVVENGEIEIVAAGSARLSGRLTARKAGPKAARITVTSGADIVIAGTAVVNARGGGTEFDGGDIVFKAGTDLNAGGGAFFSAAAGAEGGNGGFIELSGKTTVSLGKLGIDLSAPKGVPGTFLVDPEFIELTDTLSTSPGADVRLEADKYITVTSTGLIDTRDLDAHGQSQGDSGDVTLVAPNITVEDGGQILAEANNGFAGGDVSFIASKTDTTGFTGAFAFPASSTDASITVDGIVTGHNVTLAATSRSIASYADEGAGIATVVFGTGWGFFTGLNGGYVAADATASTLIGSHANITATGNVDLYARAFQKADTPVITISNQRAYGVAVVAGRVEGGAQSRIASGAQVSAGGNLGVIATNEAELNITALAIAESNSTIEAAAAHGSADIQTSARIDSGANITVDNGSNVAVLARNDNDFSVAATVMSLADGKAGAALAISDTSTSANAHLGADIGTDAAKAGNVIVEGNSITARNRTSSSTTVGDGLVVSFARKQLAKAADKIGLAAQSAAGSSKAGDKASSSTPRFASAVTVADSDLSASADISADNGASAPRIKAAGAVAVYARSEQTGLRNNAASTINSEAKDPTPDKPEATKSFSVAVAVGDFTQTTSAFVGEGVAIDGSAVGVAADSVLPLTIFDFRWETWHDYLANIASVANGNGGVVSNLLTSYADATSKGTELSIAGAANVLDFHQTTAAWIASNASITQTAPAGTPSSWAIDGVSFVRENGAAVSALDNETWNKRVSVRAFTFTESVNIGGNFSWLTFFGSGGQSTDAKAVGGALNLVTTNVKTYAGISDGVIIEADDDLEVDAKSIDRIVAVSPTAGEGDGLGGNGIISITELDTATHASISDKAKITAGNVSVTARQALAISNLAGAVSGQGSGSVGIAVAYSGLTTGTRAFIGDNSGELATIGFDNSINPNAGNVTEDGSIKAENVVVAADTAADIDTLAVAAAKASDKENGWIGSVSSGLSNAILSSKQKQRGPPSSWSLAAAGSSAVTETDLDTEARISGAHIEGKTPTDSVDVEAAATTNAQNLTFSGAAAIDQAQGNKNWSAAIAGAIAISLTDNDTRAAIDTGTVITRAGSIDVYALAGGELAAVGIGLGLNISADRTKAFGVAGSVSVVDNTDSAEAAIEDADITGHATSGGNLDVVAYQSTDIGTGAGSIYKGGKGGFGSAFTHVNIAEPDGGEYVRAAIVDTAVASMQAVNIEAINAVSIASGGASIGAADNAFSGAAVVVDVDSSTVAALTADHASSKSIDVSGDVNVSADGRFDSELNTILSNAYARVAPEVAFVSEESGIDYSGADIDPSIAALGASVVAVAGTVQIGKQNLGLGVAATDIARTHAANLDGVHVTTDGDVNIKAKDSARIIGAAVGVAVSTGQFAGEASVVDANIASNVQARAGGPDSAPATTSIEARNVAIAVENSSDIRVGAGLISASTQGGALGIALLDSDITSNLTALASGSRLQASGNILVDAASAAKSYGTSIGVAVGSKAGVAGSAVSSQFHNNVLASIENGADVIADGSVGVLADNKNEIASIAGALGASKDALGLGVSVIDSEVDGDTIANISGASTKVDAKALAGKEALEISTGELRSAINLDRFDAPTDDPRDLSTTTRQVEGIAVVSTASQSVTGIAVTAGFAKNVAIAVSPVVNLIGGSTKATVDAAKLATRIGKPAHASRPDVAVTASNHAYANSLTIGLAGTLGVPVPDPDGGSPGSSGFAGGGAAVVNKMERTTQASVTDATIGAAGDVDIRARSTNAAKSVSVGFAGSGASGLAGSGIVNVFDATTTAELSGGMADVGSLSITSIAKTGLASAAGAGALAGNSGGAAAFVVSVNDNDTNARLGRSGATTTVKVPGAVNLNADFESREQSYAAGGAGAGGYAFSGMVNVASYQNQTNARVEGVQLNAASGDAGASAFNVIATETIGLDADVGGISLAGSGGFGAALNLIMFKGGVSAGVVDSNVNVAGDATVAATSDKTIDALTFTGAAGVKVGIGAAVGVILVGGDLADGNSLDKLNEDENDHLDSDNSFQNTINRDGNGSVANAGEFAASHDSSIDLADRLGSTAKDAVTAEITGGQLTAGNVGVSARAKVSTSNTSVGAGLSGYAGVGAGIGYTGVKNSLAASVSQGTVNAETLSVEAGLANASGGEAIELDVGAGGGAAGGALSAGVALGKVESSVTAVAGGDLNGTGAGVASISASDDTSVLSEGIGIAVAGGGAASGTVVRAQKSSAVKAAIADSTTLDGYTGVSVEATSTGRVRAVAKAGAGALAGAGAGADAEAKDSSSITARIGKNAIVNTTVNGTLTLAARATPDVSSNTIGASVGGAVAIGASLADATTVQTVLVEIDNGAQLTTSRLAATAETILPSGQQGAHAKAHAGAGSLVGAGSGAEANATAGGSVEVRIGNDVVLPEGAVVLRALSNTGQNAEGLAVTVGGILAIGVALAHSKSDVTTSVTLGTNVTTGPTRNETLSIEAHGIDTNLSNAIAGSGGLVSGNGAEATTRSDSDASISIGDDSLLAASSITFKATQEDHFKATSASGNAAVIGASGSKSKHDANRNISIDIGDRVHLTSLGSSPMMIVAKSLVQQDGDEPSTTAGAGGGLNGVGAVSFVNIDSDTSVTLGNDVAISSGTSPSDNPGGILIDAVTNVSLNDSVVLTTGGVIQGAGVESNLDTRFDGSVVLGQRNRLISTGNIGLGVTLMGAAFATSGVSTWGLAAVGAANSFSRIDGAQTVSLGEGTVLSGFGNVYVTAGRSADGRNVNDVYASATADGTIRGIIAVPWARARSWVDLTGDVTVASSAVVESAQNVVVGTFAGRIDAAASGVARGYQLGFIPVTDNDGKPSTSYTGTTRIDGRVSAGIYHDLKILIDCGGSICGANTVPTVDQLSGYANDYRLLQNFDAQGFVVDTFDATTEATLAAGVSSTPVNAVYLAPLFAAGGTVTLHTDVIQGTGEVQSYGGPTIEVVNNSSAYLIVDGAYIPDTPGGQVIFTGSAGRSNVGALTLVEQSGNGPRIYIDNAYSGAGAGTGGFGPALFFTDNVTNVAGAVEVNNATGSIGLAANMNAQQVTMTAPEGAFAVSANGPGGLFNVGGSPFSEWANAIYYPGGNPASGNPDPLTAIAWVANLTTPGSNRSELNRNLWGKTGDLDPYRLDSRGNRTGFNYVLIGDCSLKITGNCGKGYQDDFFGSAYYFGGEYYYYPNVPYYAQRRITAAYSDPVYNGNANSSQIYGSQVAVKASVINVNGRISAGRSTDWSVRLNDSLLDPVVTHKVPVGFKLTSSGLKTVYATQITGGGEIAIARYKYAQGDIGSTVRLESIGTVSNGDSQIGATYDIANDRIILDDVNASSGGGFLLLDGKIISTNLYGKIHVNGGLGQVDVQNNTDIDISLGRINTGNTEAGFAPTSRVKIVDRLQSASANTTTFIYTPGDSAGSGVKVYRTGYGQDPILNGAGATAPVQSIAGDTAHYDPRAGARFEWSLYATLSREKTGVVGEGARYLTDWSWDYPSSQPNNPWRYQVGGWQLYDQSNPRGSVAIRTPGQEDFIQTMDAGHGYYAGVNGHYHGCGNPCHYGFTRTSEDDWFSGHEGEPFAGWLYYMPRSAWLRLDNSIKADNRIAVDFAGNATARVNVQSLGGIIVSNALVNPSGTMTLAANGGALVQGTAGSVLTKDATLNAHDGISGTGSAAFGITMTNGGSLRATANNDIDLSIDSDAHVARVESRTGDVTLKAAGDLVNWSGNAPTAVNVVGRDVVLSSRNGAIGEASRPINVDFTGNLSGDALRDIHVADRGSGDASIDHLHSQSGDVSFSTPGRILDANEQTANANVSDAAIQSVAERLKLTSTYGAEANATKTSVTSFERLVESAYRRYFDFLDKGTVTGGVYQIDAQYLPLYSLMAKQQLGLSGDPTNAQISAFVAGQYTAVTDVLERAYGSSWQTAAPLQTFDAGFTYQASTTQTAELTRDAVWSIGQLSSAIDASALKPASGVVSSGNPLFVGRDVSLVSGANIGSTAPSVFISNSDLKSGSLTAEQKAALAVATTPGSVLARGTNDATGAQVVGLDLANVPAGITVTGVDVARTAPIYLSASGTLNASASGDVFLQATPSSGSAGSTLTVGQITSGGNVRLAAIENILGAGISQTAPISPIQIDATGNLTLTAGAGSIGTALVPFTYRIGGDLLSASAGQNAFLKAVQGDMRIGRVFAQGNANLQAPDGLIVDTLTGVAIAADSIDLQARDGFGTSANALALQVGAGGALSGSTAGDVNIYSPTLSSQSPVKLNVSGLSGRNVALGADGALDAQDVIASGGSLEISSGADLTAAGLASSGTIKLASVADMNLGGQHSASGTIDLTAAGAIDFQAAAEIGAGGNVTAGAASIAMAADAEVVSAAVITFTANGDAALGRLRSTQVPTSPRELIVVDAGRILTADPTTANIVATAPNATARLAARNGIGQAGNAVVAEVPSIVATADNGDIFLSGKGVAITFANVTATSGNAVIDGAGDVTVTKLTAGNDATLSSGGDMTVATLTATRDATLTSGAGLNVTKLTAGRNARLNARGGALTAQDIEATAGLLDVRATGAVSLSQRAVAGTTATVASTGGSLDIVSLTSGGDQSLTAAQNVVIASAASTGGSIAATATAGRIAVTSLDANGDIGLTAGTTLDATTLTAGNDATLTSGGEMTVATLTATRDATLTSGAGLNVTKLTAGRNARLNARGGALTAQDIEATAGLLDVRATGAVSLSQRAVAGTTATVASTGGSLDIVSLTSGGDQSLTAAQNVVIASAASTGGSIAATATVGRMAVTTLDANGDIGLTAGTTLDATTLTAGNDATLSSGGDMTVATLTATRDATLTSGAGLNVTKLTAGRNARLNARGGALTAQDIEATAGLLDVRATGAVSLSQRAVAGTTATVASTGGSLDIVSLTSGGDQSLTAAQNVVIASAASTGGSIAATATVGRMAVTTLDANGDIGLTAGTTLDATTLTAGNDATLSSGGDMTVASLNATRDATLTSGAGLTVTKLTAGRNGSLVAATDVSFSDLSIGEALSVNARAGALTGGNVDAGGSATLHGETSNTGNQAVSRTGRLLLTSTGLIDWNRLSAGTDLIVSSTAGSVKIERASASGKASVKALRAIDIEKLVAGGKIDLNARKGGLTAGSLIAGASIVASGNGIVIDFAEAGSNARIVSRADLVIDTLIAGGTANLQAGSGHILSVKTLQAASTNMSVDGTLIIDDLRVEDRLGLAATELVVNVSQVGNGSGQPIEIDVTGFKGGVADRADLFIDAPNGIVFGTYRVVDSRVETGADRVSFLDATVPGRLDLFTLRQHVIVDNRIATPDGNGTLRLYQPGGDFALAVNGWSVLTDAFVVDFGNATRVTMTNFNDARTIGAFFPGGSLVQDVPLQNRNGVIIDYNENTGGELPDEIKLGLYKLSFFIPGGAPPVVEGPDQGPAVNVGQGSGGRDGDEQ